MKITIKKLTLTNFKCFRSKEIIFNEDITTISGENGAGKTTIADAITWCLFGKSSQGSTKFEIKSHDKKGITIPHLDHSVELVLNVDGREVVLTRTLKENWTRKRDEGMVFKNNTTEYLINGEDTKAGDYDKYIGSLIGEDLFKLITNPNVFPSLNWKEQRQFLSNLVDELSAETIAGGDADLLALANKLEQDNKDIISHRKHISHIIKGIKEKLEKIPVRLEEQNKALPERQDWDAIEENIKDLEGQIAELEKKYLSIKAGFADETAKEQLRQELNRVRAAIQDIERKAEQDIMFKRSENDKNIRETRKKFFDTSKTIADIDLKLSSLSTLINRCKETIDDCALQAQDIREKWADNEQRRIDIPDNATTCPTCGQQLPYEVIEENIKKAKQAFADHKQKVRDELTEKAGKVKALKAEAEQQISDYEKEGEELKAKSASLKEELNKIQSVLHNYEVIYIPSVSEYLKDDESYQDKLKQKDELVNKIDSVDTISEDETKILNDIVAQKKSLSESIIEERNKLSIKTQYDRIINLIADIDREQTDLIKQLSELEKLDDVAMRFQDRMNYLLEEQVNKHFSLVKWKMFRTVNNGGEPYDEPYCECYVNGTAYHDGLNQAACLNAGLDIINSLCKYYKVSAPIVLDNTESTLNIIETIGQQIRLEVSPCELTIKN